MYRLNNVIVSGTHYVYHPSLKWIQVKKHPDATIINNYNKPYIYCINTSNKRININNTIFADWDDLDSEDLNAMKKFNIASNVKNIHQKTDSGLLSSTIITLKNGKKIPIHKIQPGDILENNTYVNGIVKIQANDIKNQHIYKFKQHHINGSNLYFTSSHLGKFTKQKVSYQDTHFYHLITNTGKFHINGIELYDYNSAIENTLDIRNLYL